MGLDDVSLSIAVTLTENALRLAKEPLVNAVNATGRLAFDITISGIESERAFIGTLFDGKGEKQFRGRFSGMARKTRGANKPEPSPDGRSLQELIAISSLQRGANIVTPNPEEKQGSVDLAQNEANRLFGRIMLGSVPKDVQDKLYPNVIKLDAEEIKVQEMGKEFFKRAGIHYLMKQLAQSPDIKPELKGKVNVPACEIFLTVCGSLKKPAGDAHDPVTAYGWDREKDKVILAQLQGEYQRVVLECYKLGYRRVVTAFHPFLAQAKYWYQRYAKYVLTPQHTNEFKNRVVAKGETGATLYSLQVKLTLLKEAANGDIGDAKDVATILAELQGSAGMGFIEQVGWDATTQQEVLEASDPLICFSAMALP
ncbi:hypothetical protein EXIGLDRAFT_256737 [Exidia glandulosa HHB12029]|uniref:Uncharacterized protein n=1 Tax=Exidia glandulosa HHB12029 TaxID=1314781 RepID=A0A165DV66_EXIGL|nr:hypothetical protein EXIGLDRAFT_256737 [Exidia glandulosa HHB12029]